MPNIPDVNPGVADIGGAFVKIVSLLGPNATPQNSPQVINGCVREQIVLADPLTGKPLDIQASIGGAAAFSALTGQPTDNANMAAALNGKAPATTNTAASTRSLNGADNSAIIPTPSTVTFTVPTGLGSSTNRFGCAFIGAGAVTVSGTGSGGQATVTDHRDVVGAVGYFRAALMPTGTDTYDLVGTKAS